ncbi:hypothetical protein [Celeribacter halophilus]|uniref:hypothetical protein n=1 Tax=Celeribacter halophilus TaxID=576117 RepID=UPI003A93A9E2
MKKVIAISIATTPRLGQMRHGAAGNWTCSAYEKLPVLHEFHWKSLQYNREQGPRA